MLRTVCAVMISAVVTSCLFGCFTIRNMDGLQLAFEDADALHTGRVELELLQASPTEMNQARRSYNEARAKINAYLDAVLVRASNYRVNEPMQSYEATGARNSVNAFSAVLEEIREKRTQPPRRRWWFSRKTTLLGQTAEIQIVQLFGLKGVAAEVLMAIGTLHMEAQRQAYERFKSIVENRQVEPFD